MKSAVLLSDGSISNIEYVVDGNEIHATLSVPVVAGENEPVADQGWAECAFATIGNIATIGAIPVTGGASAVILPHWVQEARFITALVPIRANSTAR
ncbi:hypothetical protein ACXM2N_05100 [Corynebacterium sp. ZY180755]